MAFSLFDGLELVKPVVLDTLLGEKLPEEAPSLMKPRTHRPLPRIPPLTPVLSLSLSGAAGGSRQGFFQGALDAGLFSALDVQSPAGSTSANGVDIEGSCWNPRHLQRSEKVDPAASPEHRHLRQYGRRRRASVCRITQEAMEPQRSSQSSLDDLYAAAPQRCCTGRAPHVAAASDASPADPAVEEKPTAPQNPASCPPVRKARFCSRP